MSAESLLRGADDFFKRAKKLAEQTESQPQQDAPSDDPIVDRDRYWANWQRAEDALALAREALERYEGVVKTAMHRDQVSFSAYRCINEMRAALAATKEP